MAIFALDYTGFKVAKSYTFESPRVGNQAFAEAFDRAFARRFPVFRVTHHKDPAVHVPPMRVGWASTRSAKRWKIKHAQTNIGIFHQCSCSIGQITVQLHWFLPVTCASRLAAMIQSTPS